MPMVRVIWFPSLAPFCLFHHRAVGERGAAQCSGVDRVRIDVELQFAVVLGDQVFQRLHRSLVLGDAAGEGELVADAARARQDRHRPQDDRAVQAGHDVLALVAQRQPVAQLGAGEHRAGRVDADGLGRLHRHRPQLVQAHVHLVGDVAEVAAAAGRAAVVHLEALHDARRVDLDGLGVLSADVQHRGGTRIHHVGAQAVAQDFRAHVFLRERQAGAAVPGAHHIGLLHRGVQDALDRRLDRHAPALRLRQLDEGSLQRRQQVAPDRVGIDAVFHVDDGAVEQVQQEVVAGAGFLGHGLADRQVLAAGDVAEEVALALGAGGEQRRRLRLEPPEHLGERLADGGRGRAEMRRGQVALAGLLQVDQLLQVLLGAEVAFQLVDEGVEAAVQRMGAAQRLPEQVEAAVEQRLLLGDGRRGVVVRARIGDPAPDDALVPVQPHRLGGGRAQVDADEAAHCVSPLSGRRPAPCVSA
jgi:hypothetical protein